MARRRESPLKRINPSGKAAWVARWTDRDGKRRYGFPPTIPGTYDKRGPCREGGTACCAQHAIDACYELDAAGPLRHDTVGEYFKTWVKHHPRAERTNKTNSSRLRAVLDVKLEGAPLRDWPLADLRRRHASALVAVMLADQGRAQSGAQSVLRSLSAMMENAIDDDLAVGNPFKGVKVRAGDPRIQKPAKPIRVWSWEQMHEFAAACAVAGPGQWDAAYRAAMFEPMIRTLSDCGLRIGELLGLYRSDLELAKGRLLVRRTADAYGRVTSGTKSDRMRGLAPEESKGREVPLPPELAAMLDAMPKRMDSLLLFPSWKGGAWTYNAFTRVIWYPAQGRSGMDPRPHEFRHSYVTHMRAAGVDDADLAAITGHTVQTMVARYAHSLGRSFDVVRKAVGE